ncbi:MAG: response regulator [Hyphomonadaceae bacterium]|nr:response regulator [Hyphomonadaceae bacterium]
MASLSEMRVFIVDDNEQMRHLLGQMLRAGGFVHIGEAATADEALSVLGRLSTDIVVLDWKMTPIDGIALTRAIRRGDSGNPCTPIVMLTAHTEGSRVAAARDAGVTGFVKKPVSARLLFDRVASALTDPRMFVRTADFFGPDRRHTRQAQYEGPFRRESDRQSAFVDLDDDRLRA